MRGLGKFKKVWPEWIAGFDLVGEESKGRPIKDFIPELLKFQENCEAAKLEIPFLFHCALTMERCSDLLYRMTSIRSW
ncbi:hypothetical protein NCS55_00307700 [Fusarium keratoplasticum]|nr:hypothetical protein NCS55_00307700 [Fusarium keratoplasticum]